MSNNPTSYQLTFRTDLTDFDKQLGQLGAYFTQSETYRLWQDQAGRDVRVFVFEKNTGESTIPLMIFLGIVHTISFGKKILDIPHGPVVLGDSTETEIQEFTKKLKEFLKKENIIFARLSPFPETAKNYFKAIPQAPGLSYQAGIFQPRFEWLIDTTQDLDSLLADMKKGTRYSIRHAEQKGVVTEIVTDNLERYAETLFTLMTKTGKRNGFRPHPLEYYKKILQTQYGTDSIFLVVASYENIILCVNVIFCRGEEAIYLFSASSDDYKELQASYLAQWKSIEEVKKRGITTYSLGGISTDTSYASWRSITAFKQKFPGTLVDYGPWHDIVNQPLWYHLYSLYRFVQKLKY